MRIASNASKDAANVIPPLRNQVDAIVYAIKDVFDAQEIYEQEWHEIERAHNFVTWDFTGKRER